MGKHLNKKEALDALQKEEIKLMMDALKIIGKGRFNEEILKEMVDLAVDLAWNFGEIAYLRNLVAHVRDWGQLPEGSRFRPGLVAQS